MPLIPSEFACQKIDELGKKFNDPLLLNRINCSLLKREAVIYEHESVGVVVTKPTYHNGKPSMLIWVAIGIGINVIETYLPLFEMIAKQTGMKFIVFETKRRGFSRFIKKFDFIEDRPRGGFFVFTKEV
jgi:hypothetical protein